MSDNDFLVGPIEELADNLELYVKQLYAIRDKIRKGVVDEDLEADYAEALEIKGIWDSLGDIPV